MDKLRSSNDPNWNITSRLKALKYDGIKTSRYYLNRIKNSWTKICLTDEIIIFWQLCPLAESIHNLWIIEETQEIQF